MSSKTFFITGATGNVGHPLVHLLLSKNHHVNVLTSNPDSERAQALAKAGAKLFKGELDDEDAIAAAATGCTGLYLNPSPSDLSKVLHSRSYAQTIMRIAKSANIETCVYQSSLGAGEIETWPAWEEWLKDSRYGAFYLEHRGNIVHDVRNAGFKYWTALRGAHYSSNFATERQMNSVHVSMRNDPIGTITMAVSPETPVFLTDSLDLAKMGALALTEPERFNGKTPTIISDSLKLSEIAGILSKYGHKKIEAVHPSAEEIRAQRQENMLMGSGAVLETVVAQGVTDESEAFGITRRKFDDYIASIQESFREALAAPQVSHANFRSYVTGSTK